MSRFGSTSRHAMGPIVGIDVQIACDSAGPLPDVSLFERWAEHALQAETGELCLRVVDEPEGAELNQQWRGRESATNVLSFPSELSVPGLRHFGDIVVCAPVVLSEAAEQGKDPADHFAHLTIHGVLHLRGFDHVDPDAARVMEALEVELLGELGIANPYELASEQAVEQ